MSENEMRPSPETPPGPRRSHGALYAGLAVFVGLFVTFAMFAQGLMVPLLVIGVPTLAVLLRRSASTRAPDDESPPPGIVERAEDQFGKVFGVIVVVLGGFALLALALLIAVYLFCAFGGGGLGRMN